MSAPYRSDFGAPIIHNTYELYLSWHKSAKNLPKYDRYSLGVKLESLIIGLLTSLFQANRDYGYRRINLLNQASDQLDFIKIIIRLLLDTGAISKKSYIELQALVQEIGRQLGGRIKSQSAKNPA